MKFPAALLAIGIALSLTGCMAEQEPVGQWREAVTAEPVFEYEGAVESGWLDLTTILDSREGPVLTVVSCACEDVLADRSRLLRADMLAYYEWLETSYLRYHADHEATGVSVSCGPCDDIVAERSVLAAPELLARYEQHVTLSSLAGPTGPTFYPFGSRVVELSLLEASDPGGAYEVSAALEPGAAPATGLFNACHAESDGIYRIPAPGVGTVIAVPGVSPLTEYVLTIALSD